MSISDSRRWAYGVSNPTRRTARSHARLRLLATVENLEKRWAMSAIPTATPAIQMISATTMDSKSVTIDYQVNETTSTADPIQFGIYRSSNGQFDSSDSLVSTFTLNSPETSSAQGNATLDQSGQLAAAIGTHQLTIPLPQGLVPYPEKPYVLVVADPSATLCNDGPTAICVVSYLHHRDCHPWWNTRSQLETRPTLGDRDCLYDEARGI